MINLFTSSYPANLDSHKPNPKLTYSTRAKRYERMMKAHGIHQSQTTSTIRDTPIPSPHRKTSSTATTTASAKKRKLDQFAETGSGVATDDDEGLSANVKKEPALKGMPHLANDTIKAEPVDTTIKTEGPAIRADAADTVGSSSKGTVAPAIGSGKTVPFGLDGTDELDHFFNAGGYTQEDSGFQASMGDGISQHDFPDLEMPPTSGAGQGMPETILITD